MIITAKVKDRVLCKNGKPIGEVVNVQHLGWLWYVLRMPNLNVTSVHKIPVNWTEL